MPYYKARNCILSLYIFVWTHELSLNSQQYYTKMQHLSRANKPRNQGHVQNTCWMHQSAPSWGWASQADTNKINVAGENSNATIILWQGPRA